MAKNSGENFSENFQIAQNLNQDDFPYRLFIESYGIRIGFSANTTDGIKDIRKTISLNMPDCFCEIAETETEHSFKLNRSFDEKDAFYKDDELIFSQVERKNSFDIIGSKVRITVAEFAVGRVFIHSGAVGRKGKAILIPGKSFSGKTSLTAALVKRGAIYYSDEYAVLDKNGLLHPFPKTLSIRGIIDDFTQVEHTVESLGGKAGKKKIPVGMILLTEYKPDAKWKPEILSPANGLMEVIKNTIPIRSNPDFVLKSLGQMTNRALIVKSKRGDVENFAGLILDYFETNCL